MLTITRPASTLARLAGPAMLVSAVTGAVAVGLLAAMYAAFAAGSQAAGLRFGYANDVLGIVTPALAAPAVLIVSRLVAGPRSGLAAALVIVGLGSVAAVIVLQSLLVAKLVAFQQQVLPVVVAMLVWGGWFVAVGFLGSRSGSLPVGPGLGVSAMFYVGYPVWAWRVGRFLLVATRTSPATGSA